MAMVNYTKHSFVGSSKLYFLPSGNSYFYPLGWFTKLQKIENVPWSLPKISYRKLQSSQKMTVTGT